jgi:cold shock CspA family protein
VDCSPVDVALSTHQIGEDVFVRFAAIEAGEFRSLQEGQAVLFDVTKGPKGWQAENVRQSNVTTKHARYPKGFRASLPILVLQLPDRAFVPKLAPDCTVSFGAI